MYYSTFLIPKLLSSLAEHVLFYHEYKRKKETINHITRRPIIVHKLKKEKQTKPKKNERRKNTINKR